MTFAERVSCGHMERVASYALNALPPGEAAEVQAHLATCPECRRELETLKPVAAAFASWPQDILSPSGALWARIANRIALETGGQPMSAGTERHSEAAWESVGPGLSCKVLATDSDNHRTSLLVRLAPRAEYPPHKHGGVEELHLLCGELWIGNRKLSPGDYNRAEPGTSDRRVWSETGCTCVLITSTRDLFY